MTALVGTLLLLLATVVCEVCNENIVERKIASGLELIETLQEIQNSSLQNIYYSLLFDFNTTIELNINQIFSISSNVSLQGSNTTIRCNVSASYKYAGIINVNNVENFTIIGISFIACPSTFIRFENISDITILECSFSDFTEVPIYFFNCQSLSVINCTFINNTASARYLFRSFEGNAGGLSFGWNNLLLKDRQSTVNVHIYNCTFYKNSARGRVRDFNPSTDALEARTFTGRGGGVALVFNAISNVTVTIELTKFEENFANGFGGGLFILIDGISANQSFDISNNHFLSNTARFGGAAIFFGYLSSISNTDISTIAIKDCWFIRNRRGFVGAISFALTYISGLTNFLQISNSKFYYNEADEYGTAVGLFHANFLSPKTDVSPLEIITCEFVGNVGGRGGILSIAYFPVSFYGNVTFINNSGPAFRVVGSVVNVKGAHLTFMGNNAAGLAGGAMYLTSYTQVILSQGSTFDFINNTGSVGASMVVETQAVPSLLSRSYYNRLCFLQFDQQIENMILPEEWKEVTFNFEGNSAIVGSALFIDRLSLCSWNSAAHPYFFLNETFRWSFMHYDLSNRNLGHGTYDDVMLDLQTPAIYFTLNHSSNVSSYPGQDKLLELTAYDELNQSTAAIFRYGIVENTIEANIVQFNPSAHLYQPANSGVKLDYSLSSLTYSKTSYIVQVTSDTVNEASEHTFELHLAACQPGYSLQNTSNGFVCLCNDGVLIETCIGNNLILKYGLWAHYTGSELFLYQCPPGYCRCNFEDSFGEHTCLSIYRIGNESLQCDCNREGLLCGSCKEGKGISTLLNNCVSCIGVGWLLIMLLVIVDATVATLIIIFSVRIPSWILPFFYYIQITPYIMENLNYSFSEGHKYLYFLSSGLSLYFPYDFCLFDEMDAVASYGIRYIPIITTGIVIVVLFTIYKIFLRRKWKFSWNGVWTLLILQYSHVVYTSLSILNCPSIPAYQGDGSGKWYIDATVQCFHGTHAIIGTVAIIFVIMSVCFVPFIGLVCSEVILKVTLRNFIDAVNSNISSQYKWWSSVELSRRLIIIAILLPFPGNNAPPLLMMMLIFAIYIYFLSNMQMSLSSLCFETISLGSIIVMLALKTTNYIEESLDRTLEPINDENCQNSQVLTELTLLLLVLYYFPVLVAATYFIIRISKKHIHWMHMRKKFTTDDAYVPIELQRPSRVASLYVIVQDDGTVTMSH